MLLDPAAAATPDAAAIEPSAEMALLHAEFEKLQQVLRKSHEVGTRPSRSQIYPGTAHLSDRARYALQSETRFGKKCLHLVKDVTAAENKIEQANTTIKQNAALAASLREVKHAPAAVATVICWWMGRLVIPCLTRANVLQEIQAMQTQTAATEKENEEKREAAKDIRADIVKLHRRMNEVVEVTS